MVGKQRTKANTKASSSANSANLLGETPIFGFSSSILGVPGFSSTQEEVFDSNISNEFQIALKKLSKKDPVTKIKALKDFTSLINETDSPTLKLILIIWPKHYQNLSIDPNNSVREQVQLTHKTIANKAGKTLAPVLKQLVPVWITSQFDNHSVSRNIAVQSFKDSFPPNKIPDVLKFSEKEFFEFIFKNLTFHTASTLNTPIKCTPDEAEFKYQRLVICSLRGLSYYLDSIKDVCESDVAQFLENQKFWSFSKSKDVQIKSAWFQNLQSILEHYPSFIGSHKSKVFGLLFNLIGDCNQSLMPNVWGCILLLQQQNSDWIQESKFFEGPSRNLLSHLNSNLGGSAAIICPALLPFVSAFQCEKDISENKIFVQKMLEALRIAIETQNLSKKQFTEVLTSFLECMKYVIHKSDNPDDLIENNLVQISIFSFNCVDLKKREEIHNAIANLLKSWYSNNRQALADVFLRKLTDKISDFENVDIIIAFVTLLPKDSSEVVSMAELLLERSKQGDAANIESLFKCFPKLFTEKITEECLQHLHTKIAESSGEIFDTIFILSKSQEKSKHISYIEELIRNDSVSFNNKIILLSNLFHDESEKEIQEQIVRNPLIKEIIIKISDNFDSHSQLFEKIHEADDTIVSDAQILRNLHQTLRNKGSLRLATFLLRFMDNSADIFLEILKFSLNFDSSDNILEALAKFPKDQTLLEQCHQIVVKICDNQKIDLERTTVVINEVFFKNSKISLHELFGSIDYSAEENYFLLKDGLQHKFSVFFLPDCFVLGQPNLNTFCQMASLELFTIERTKPVWTNYLYDRVLAIMKVSAVSEEIELEINKFIAKLDPEIQEQFIERILSNAARGDYASIKSFLFLIDLCKDADGNSSPVFSRACDHFLEKKLFRVFNNLIEIFTKQMAPRSLARNAVIAEEGSLFETAVFLRLLVQNNFLEDYNSITDMDVILDVIGFITTFAENPKGQMLYNENIAQTSFEKIAQTIQVCRLLSVAIKKFPQELTMKIWDFVRISLSSWVLSISKTIENIHKAKVLLFVRSVLELYQNLTLFIQAEKRKSSTAVLEAVINEWENLFAKEVNIVLFKAIRVMTSKDQTNDSCWDEIMKASYESLKLLEFKYIFNFYKHNSSHSLDEMFDFFIDKLSSESHWVRLCAMQTIKGLSLIYARHESEDVENNKYYSSSFIKKFIPHLVKAEAQIKDYLQEFTYKSNEVAEFQKIDGNIGRHFLSLWECICFACSMTELKSFYCTEVEKNFAFESFLNFLIRSLPVEMLKNFDNTLQIKWFQSYDLEKENIKFDLYALYVLRRTVKTLPTLVRKWWNNGHSRQKIFIDKLITNYISKSIVKEQLQEIAGSNKDETMSIVVHNSTREIVATYTLDEVSMELILTLPFNYPLSGVKVEHLKQIGGKSSVRNFGMQLTKFLNHMNGSLLDGLKLWKQNLDKKFQGVEECFICYTIIHQGTCALPKLSCRTCRQKFHAPCLYKWFTTSNKSTCPICRNIF